MKNNYLTLILLTLFVVVSCGKKDKKAISADIVKNPVTASGIETDTKMPSVEVIGRDGKDGRTFDFGVLIQGENVVHTFELKNTGDADLIIISASASCGCTVPTFSKEPISPNESGKVEVAFASSGRSGKQLKTVTLLTNAQPAAVTLTIVANIVVPN